MMTPLMDGINETLNTHAGTLTEVISNHGYQIRNRLDEISKGILESNRRHRWGRATFQYTAGAEIIGSPNGPTIALTPPLVVPKNEVWLLRSFPFTSNQTESLLTIENQGRQVIWAAKQHTSGIGGDALLLPGEEIYIGIASLKANQVVWGSIVYERVLLVDDAATVNLGAKAEVVGGRNTHDPLRDQIMTIPGPRPAEQPEVVNTAGRPPMVDNGVDPTGV